MIHALQAHIEHTPIAAAVLDTDMCYLAYSQSWAHKHHIQDRDLRGKPFEQSFLKTSDQQKRLLALALKGEKSQNSLNQVTLLDGSSKLYSFNIQPYFGSDDAVSGVVIYIQGTLPNTSSYEQWFLHSNDALALFSPLSQTFIKTNKSALHLFGMTEEAFYKADLKAFYPTLQPDGRISLESLNKHLATTLREGSHVVEWLCKRSDGYCFYSTVSMTLADTDAGPIIQFNFRQCSDCKPTLAILDASEKKYRSLFENSLDMIHIIDEKGRIIDANPQEIRTLGYGDQLIGKPLIDLIDPEFKAITREKLLALRKGEAINCYETRMVTYSGNKIDVEASVFPYMDQGKMISAHAILRDITERKENEKKYRALFEESLDMIHIVDNQGFIIDANRAQMQTLGYSLEELRKIRVIDIIAPEDRENAKPRIQRILKGEEIGNYESILLTKSGQRIFMEARTTPHVKDGKMLFAHTIFTDITERKQKEIKLKQAAITFENLSEGLIITDAQTNILDVNPAFTRLTGHSRELSIGLKTSILRSGRQSPAFYEEMWAQISSRGQWQGELWNRRSNGSEYFAKLFIKAIKDNTSHQVTNYIGLLSDISITKKHQLELEHIAHYDQLTNLPNRLLLLDRLALAISQSKRQNNVIAVAYLDLDGFKQINDTYGHNIGDEFLIKVSERLQASLREGDTLSRIGGDEFLVILANLESKAESEVILERLLSSSSQSISIKNQRLMTSASIGVSFAPTDSAEPDILIRQADQAMYQAKQTGKNRYHFFDKAQDTLLKSHHDELIQIKKALSAGEFILWYQPKVNMRTGQVLGLEALIRWQHPSKGLMQPAEFLPIIANEPLCIDIGEWVIHSALQQIQAWKAQGLTLSIAVNIEALHLQQENFVLRLKEILSLYPDINPQLLKLEILETSMMHDLKQAHQIIEDCLAIGVEFALDDFGTGYSSLAYIRHLPAQLIKIDQTFVRDMLVDADDLSIVEGVINLAKAFKRSVIAEGVETIDHGTALLELGCEFGQGYAISRPMPATHLPQWIKDWKPDSRWLKRL